MHCLIVYTNTKARVTLLYNYLFLFVSTLFPLSFPVSLPTLTSLSGVDCYHSGPILLGDSSNIEYSLCDSIG